MVSSSTARTAQRWAASRRLSFKTGLVTSEAKASTAWRARDIVWDRLACDPLPDTHPGDSSLPKSAVLVKKVAVRRNIASAKRNGPRRLVPRPIR
jgi:hypothetical protein